MSNQPRICFLCSTVIGEANDSREHIIPNAIGGRKKVRGFICIECNSTSGDDWETELARQLNPLSLFFGIARDRGEAPSQKFATTGDEEYILHRDGSLSMPKPEYRETIIDAGVQISVKARSLKEARKMLKGVTKKYPQLDLSELLEQAQSESSYCSDMLRFSLSFGGNSAGRSIVKSAVALLASRSGQLPKCDFAKEYLLNQEATACFGYYYEKDLVKNRPEGMPFHCVHVEGRAAEGEIVAYAEYFGVQRVVMLLSDQYNAEDFSATYAVNPQNGLELDLEVSIDISKEEIFDAYDYKKIPEGSVESALGEVIESRLLQQREEHQSEVVEKAIAYAFDNCGAEYGETLTAEHVGKLTGLMMEKLEPYLIHHVIGSNGSK